jgi:hypothetical protein
VVQAHNSGLLNRREGLAVKNVSLTSLLILRGDLNLTGHPPVHIPHWIHTLSW